MALQRHGEGGLVSRAGRLKATASASIVMSRSRGSWMGSRRLIEVKTLAQTEGLDMTRFNECIDSGKYTAEWQADQAEGAKLGVAGTPTFFANGRMVLGAKGLEEMSKIIDEELAKAGGQR